MRSNIFLSFTTIQGEFFIVQWATYMTCIVFSSEADSLDDPPYMYASEESSCSDSDSSDLFVAEVNFMSRNFGYF